MMKHIVTWSERAFAIDVRTLAIFRIAFGCVLIAHLLQISVDLTAFFTDDGAFPRQTAVATSSATHLSLYMLSGSYVWAATLWSITLLAGICFVLGFKTRIATITLLILFLSLNTRNPLIFQAGDRLVILLLFWATLLPLGSHWSLDAKRLRKRSTNYNAVYTIASAGILLQMACLYFFTGVEKYLGTSWHEHNAVMFALQGLFSNVTRDHLLNHPAIVYALNDMVLTFELAVPLLLFLPFFQPLLRLATIIGLSIMHLSFVHFLNIGLFSFDAMAGLMLFLPATFWDRLSTQNKSVHYYNSPALTQTLSTALLLLMLYNNMATVRWVPQSDWLHDITTPVKLSQEWKMFAPNVGNRTRWTYMRAHMDDGTIVDPFNRRTVDMSLSYPVDWREVVGDNLWLKLHTRLYNSKRQHAYLAYWCRDWNNTFPDTPLIKIELLKREHTMGYPPVIKDASNVRESHLMTVRCHSS